MKYINFLKMFAAGSACIFGAGMLGSGFVDCVFKLLDWIQKIGCDGYEGWILLAVWSLLGGLGFAVMFYPGPCESQPKDDQ